MSTLPVPPHISFEEFERRYAESDQAVEFWAGEVVAKAVPTWLHGVLQALLAQFLRESGYMAGSETDLRLSRKFAPRPDVLATRECIETDYPTKPEEVEIVVEVISPDEKRLEEKCQRYVELGIAQIYAADPKAEVAYVWNRDRRKLDRVDSWTLTNGITIKLADVWRELRAAKPKRPKRR